MSTENRTRRGPSPDLIRGDTGNYQARSQHQEPPNAYKEFKRAEIYHCRRLLRRAQYLEHQLMTLFPAGESNPTAVAHAKAEYEALLWVMRDIGYLPEPA